MGAVFAVQVVVVAVALDGIAGSLAVLAGLAATIFLLATHSDGWEQTLRRAGPFVIVMTLVALGAAILPTPPGWLAALAPLAVAGLYALTLLPLATTTRPGCR